MIPALISGGASILGSVLGNMFGSSSQEAANRANMELAKYQYDRNVEMWNMQNEYNSPANQVKRLREAGLNPNLIYGNGSAATGNSESAPQYEAPQIRPYTNYGDFGLSQAANLYLASRNSSADISVKDSQAAMNRQNVINMQQDEKLKVLEQYGKALSNAKSNFEVQNLKRTYEAEMANLESRTRGNNVGADYSVERTLTEKALRPLRVSMISKQIEGYVLDNIDREFRNVVRNPLQARQMAAEISKILADTALSRQQARESISREGLLDEQTYTEAIRRKSVKNDAALKYQRYRIQEVLRENGINLSGSQLDRFLYRMNQNWENGNYLDALSEGVYYTGSALGNALSPFK